MRSPEKGAFLEADGVTFRKADLGDVDALTAAFQGCDAVVSNAALFSVGKMTKKHEAENRAANVTGTTNVYNAIAAAGVKRVVQISTFGVYRWALGRRLTEESSQLDGASGEGDAYRGTKQISEALAWKAAEEHGLQLTTIRPSGIYGARDTNVMPIVRRWVNRLRWVGISPFLWIVFPLTYAGDVADAVTQAVANDATIGEAYNTCGSDASMRSFFQAWQTVAGRKLPLFLPVPTWFPIPIRLGMYADNSKAARDLNFRNRPFEEGLRESKEQDPALFA